MIYETKISVDNQGLYFKTTPLCSATGFIKGEKSFSFSMWAKLAATGGSLMTIQDSSGNVALDI